MYSPWATRLPSLTTVRRRTNSLPAWGVGGSSSTVRRSGRRSTTVGVAARVGVGGGTLVELGAMVAGGDGVGGELSWVASGLLQAAATTSPRATRASERHS